MPDLAQSLQSSDVKHLGIIAELWGLEIPSDQKQDVFELVISNLHKPMLVNEIFLSLPDDAQDALFSLVKHDGRLPWSQFTRQYGEVREVGPGKRDRDLIYLHPISTTELLWYRAFIARAFFDTPAGPQEFAYIPDDMISLMPLGRLSTKQVFGRSAYPSEKSVVFPVSDYLIDDVCTYLAAVRLELPEDLIPLHHYPGTHSYLSKFLQAIAISLGLMDAQGTLLSDSIREFLEGDRADALHKLVQNWSASSTINELTFLPQISLEGEWKNDPIQTRRNILSFLATVPQNSWWNLDSFIDAIHQLQPDFLRRAGDYDASFIRDMSAGEFLRGFESWDRVERELLRLIITGPLHWLGILDLAAPSKENLPSAFRFSDWSSQLLAGMVPNILLPEDGSIKIRSDGRLQIDRRFPRAVRYQIARYCSWQGLRDGQYFYQLTAEALEKASKQGLRVGSLLKLLNHHASLVPPSLIKALERWDEKGVQIRIEKVTILRLSTPDILTELRRSRVSRFLGEPLGPTVIAIKPGAVDRILRELSELGYLGSVESLD
jgi:hypothetical protein